MTASPTCTTCRQVIAPPLKLPRIDIYQYWHDRFHRDPGNQWIRSIFKALFGRSPAD